MERAARHNNAVLKMGVGLVVLPGPGPVLSRRSGPAGGPDKHLPRGCDEKKGAQRNELF